MDPEVIAQLEEQLRNLTDMLSQQNSMMATQMNAMKNGANGTANAFKNASQAVNQSATKYAEAQAKAAETSEKWSTAAKLSAGTLTALGTAAGAAAGVLGSLGGALLSAEKGFSKYGATAGAAAQGVESLARAVPVVGGALGALAGALGQAATKIVTDALKLTDSIISLRDETVRTAGVLPTTSEGLLKLANDAKYYGENIQVLGKITQGLGSNLVGLGKNAGDGATKFMELANVTEETRQRFGKMGIDQQRLTELQAQYVKQQAASGLAYTLQNKSMETLRRESLKYVENITVLSGLTGKQAEELQAEQDAARAVIQEKMAQRQDLIELQNLRKAGRTEEAAALEAKMKEKAEFRDRLVGLVGPEQAAQVMRVIRTGVYDNISGPLATLGVDFQQVSEALNSGAKGIDTANKLGDQLTSAYNTQITNLGQAGLFLDEEQLKQLAINSETLGRQNLMFGKSYEEQDKLLKEMYEKRAGGSPMDDSIEKFRSFERQLQQRYQEFLIQGIQKAAALLKNVDLMALADKAASVAIRAFQAGLGVAAVAVGVLAVAKWKEYSASKAARQAQKEFTEALRASSSAMRAQSRASNMATSADRQEAAASRKAAGADLQEAGASRKAAMADIQEAGASRKAAAADLQEASASMKAASADLKEAAASLRAAQADAREAAMGGGDLDLPGGKGGKGLKGLLGKGARLLGKLALPLTGLMAAYDAFEGFMADPNAGFGESLLNAGKSALSGATFGLLGTSAAEIAEKSAANKMPGAPGGNEDALQKQLDIINSITMPGNGQDMLQTMSPEQLAAIGITTGSQYDVKKGDTLAKIAEANGITVEQLMAANPKILKKDWKEGYKLNIPGQGNVPGATTGNQQYTIQEGDTLSALAAQYGTTVEELMKANPNITNPDLIYTGGKLNIPGQGAGGSAQQMMEQLSAMAGPEMAQKLMEQIQSGQFANPQEALKSLGINMDQALAGMGTATGFMNPNQVAQLGMQPQLAFARPQGENAEEAMTEMAKGALEENASLYTPLFEDMTNQREQQTTTFNELSNSMRIFKNRTDATNKAFLDLMDAADELYEALTGRKRDRGGDEDSGPSGGSTGGNTVGSVDPEKVKQAQQFFESKGWTKEQAAGLVGNLITESKLDPTAVGDNGKAYGIAQWHPDRQAKFAQEYGKDIRNSTFEEQLEFVDWELRNNEKAAGQALSGARTASEAAAIVDKKYERSSGAALAERQANAERIAKGDIGGLAGAARDTARDIRGAGGNLNLPTASSAGSIVPLGRFLQSTLGLRVSEHPEFGGVLGKHSKNGGHYDGTAIDVNVGTGMVEANDPKWGPIFDELALAGMRAGYHTLWRTKDHHNHIHFQHSGSMGKNSKIGLPQAEKGGVFKGPDSGYLAMLHGKEAVIPLDNKFTRTQSSEQYTVNGKPATKKEYDSFMKSHPELQNLQDKVKGMLGAVENAKGDPTKMMNAVSSLMDTNLTGIKDEMVDKNKKIQDSLIQIVNSETNKAIKAVNESNLPMQTIANQMSTQMRKVMEAHTQSMNELAYKLSDMIDALNTSNDTTKKILKKASA